MPNYSYELISDCPSIEELDFLQIIGHESLSRPSYYELRLVSINKFIDVKEILGHEFTVVIYFFDQAGVEYKRRCPGYATRVTTDINVDAENNSQYTYKIVLESWFGLLKRRRNSRIFQDCTLGKIFDDIYIDSPIKRIEKSDFQELKIFNKKIDYCVQYQETDYDFISRLLEKEGVHYWFDTHEKAGTMVLADEIGSFSLPAAEFMTVTEPGKSTSEYNELSFWNIYDELGSGKYASRDSDYTAIRKKLENSKTNPDVAELNDLAQLEIFEYPGGYLAKDDLKKIEDTRINELASHNSHYSGATSWPDVRTGGMFSIKSGDESDTFCVATCTFVFTNPDYKNASSTEKISINAILESVIDKDAILADDPVGYRNLIDFMGQGAFKSTVPGTCAFFITVKDVTNNFRPPRLTPRNMMPGPQSAIVVGPSDDEIHADELGRVRVHFHWDRYDESNQNSSCWIRVSQPWAGKGWGGYFIPRVGQEVIVDFLNGDPDQPIIVGRVYNDDQPIPFESHTQSGFKTRSTPKGNTKTFNELRFDDKKGSEQVYLHAEKNQDISVENDETHTVGHDRTKTIDNDEINHIKNNRTETVDNNETIKIGVDRNEKVGANETIEIGANRKEKVGANEAIDIGANRAETVGGSESVTVTANQDIQVGAKQNVVVGASRTDTVGGGVTQTIGGSLLQTVVGGITINTPGKMMVTAVGGVTFIAPGGTKFVDFQFNKLGQLSSETYGTKLDNFSFKMEVTGLAITARAINLQKVGVDNKKAELYMQIAAIGMMVETGIKVNKAPVSLSKADIEIHG